MLVSFLSPDVLDETDGDLTRFLSNHASSRRSPFSKVISLIVPKGGAYWTPPGYTAMAVGFNPRTETDLRRERRTKQPAPFTTSMFIPVLSGKLIAQAGVVAVKEIKTNASRSLAKLPQPGYTAFATEISTFIEALSGS